MIDTVSLLSIADKRERYLTAVKVFEQAKLEAGHAIDAEFQEKGISYLYAADLVEYPYQGFRQNLLKRGLALKPHALTNLAYKVLNRSCHHLFFGVDGVTELPRLPSWLAKCMLGSDRLKNEAFNCVSRLYSEGKEDGTLLNDISEAELIRSRVFELAADRYVTVPNVLGADEPSIVKISLRKFTFPDKKSYVLKNIMLLYFTMELNTSLDYFTAPNYTQYTDLRCFGAPERECIRDRLVKQVLGKYLVLSPDAKKEFVSWVMARQWQGVD